MPAEAIRRSPSHIRQGVTPSDPTQVLRTHRRHGSAGPRRRRLRRRRRATTSSSGGSTPTGLSGTIRIDGSSTVAPLTEAVAEGFQQENPDVRVTVGTSGTSGGFENFCAGETDFYDASREIEPEEEALCKEDGIETEAVQVAVDALTVVGNPENPVTCLSVDQLAEIWGPDDDRDELGRRPGPRRRVRRGARPLRTRHRLGHVRLLHRCDQRRGGRADQGLQQRRRGRQRHGDRRLRRSGRHRLLRLLVLHRERGHAQGVRGRRRRGLRRPVGGDGAGRLLRPARPAALHLPEHRRVRGRGRRPRSSTTTSPTSTASPRALGFIPLTDEQLAESEDALASLEGK